MQGGYPLSDKRDIPLSSPERGTRAPQGWTPSAESRRTVRRLGQIPSWRRPMQISRISAESGKALEIRQDDITAHNGQQSHFSMIIYRLLTPSMKMGKVQEETRCAAYQFLFVTLVFFSSVFLTPSSHHDSRTPRGISKSVFHIGSHLRGGRGRRAEEWPIHPRL